jgi:hypothetical protein
MLRALQVANNLAQMECQGLFVETLQKWGVKLSHWGEDHQHPLDGSQSFVPLHLSLN